jgi:hypothetical protein
MWRMKMTTAVLEAPETATGDLDQLFASQGYNPPVEGFMPATPDNPLDTGDLMPGEVAWVPPTPTIEPTPAEMAIKEKTIGLHVTISQMGRWRQGDISKVTTEADKASLGLRKKAIASQAYDDLLAVRSEVEGWLKRKVGANFLRAGQYLLAIDLVQETEAYLQSMKKKQKDLLEAFLLVYPDAVEEARERLKDQFKERNYPKLESMRKRFQIEWNYFEFHAAPGALKEVSAELFKSQQKKYEKLFEEAYESTRMLLRTELAEVVETLATELTPKTDGKPRRVYDSVYERLTDFLDYFDARNITDDKALAELVSRCRKIMKGVDLKDLRKKDSSVKEVVQNSLAAVKQKLQSPGFIVDVNRVYDFEDEDV